VQLARRSCYATDDLGNPLPGLFPSCDRRSGCRPWAFNVRPSWQAQTVARMQAVYYRDSRGTEPVDDFIQVLSAKRAAKIDDFIEEHLNGKPPEAPPPAFPITS
jgi:hypothetical protein